MYICKGWEGLLTLGLLQALEHYAELLTYIKSAVTRNYSEKSINNMLDFISSSSDPEDMPYMERFYDMTLAAFTGTNNERLWLKTNIKLAKLWLDRQEYGRLGRKVRTLYRACQKSDGSDDPSKGTYLLEVYAIEIQMYSEMGNNKKLKVGGALFQHEALADMISIGPIHQITQGPICCSSSQDHGNHPGVWRENAHE